MSTKQELKTFSHSVFSLHLHLVLVTKYRQRCIDAAILARLGAIFRGLADRWGCDLLEFNGEPDHVHLLLSVNPKVSGEGLARCRRLDVCPFPAPPHKNSS